MLHILACRILPELADENVRTCRFARLEILAKVGEPAYNLAAGADVAQLAEQLIRNQ